MSQSSTPPRIAIVGAGPAGLTILNVLTRNNVPATVYERDAEFTSRGHLGGMLDLKEMGQEAMNATGLYDEFLKHARFEAEEGRVTDRTGVPLIHHVPTAANNLNRPEIDRTVLRRILFDSVPAERIKWGHAIVSATPVDGTKRWRLEFANGFVDEVDLVIAADGARSRLRPLVSDAQIRYTGITGAEVSFGPDVAAAHPEIMAHVGNGTVFAMEDNRLFTVQKNGDGRVRTYAWFASPEPDVIPSDPEAAVRVLLEKYDESWAGWMREIVQLADRSAVYPRPLYALPVGHSWPHRTGITLAGDAMHVMTPYTGQGVNIAMLGGARLGKAIAGAYHGSLEDLDAAVAKYEKEHGEDVTPITRASEHYTNLTLKPGGTKEILEATKVMYGQTPSNA